MIFGLGALMSCQNDEGISMKTSAYNGPYPETLVDTMVVDTYHGNVIYDPFRWLEDDNSDQTKDWVKRQNELTFDYLEKIPYREKIKGRMREIWNYPKYSAPVPKIRQYYFFKNDGLQNQDVLMRISTLDGEEELVLDPNTFSEDGTASLGAINFSNNGKYLAYQISEGGSDWRSIHVLNLEDLKPIDDMVKWVKFSGISWAGDGFYYSRYPEPAAGDELSGKNEYHDVYYHRLGTDQSEDVMVYNDKEHPQRNAYASTTEDRKFLVISTSESTSGNALWIKDLAEVEGQLHQVIDSFNNDYELVGNKGDTLFFKTNADAPKQKLVSYNASTQIWNTIIPETDKTLRSVLQAGDRFVASYIFNASSQLIVFDLSGNEIDQIDLPGIGTVYEMETDKEGTEVFYSFTSFTVPGTIYRYDMETGSSSLFKAPELPFDNSLYTTEQVWYKSYDGTDVPMFLTYRKDLVKDGQAPTLLYGYGGFDISILPSFRITALPLLEQGGIFAVANIRGGGEFGKEWHLAGTKDRKQNVFDDFQSAAEYLINQGYTRPERLAIEGGSNGGLLVGACITKRPELYQVAFPRVGVLDMLRYHQFTIGWAWAEDYGRSDDPNAFDYLIKYSPLHNVKEKSYPATLVTTADHDDRVVPAHSFKFIAEMQRKHQGDRPVMIRIETSAGHGAGKPVSKQIDEAGDMLAFMLFNMGLSYQ